MKMRNRCPDCGIRYTSEAELALHECAPPRAPEPNTEPAES